MQIKITKTDCAKIVNENLRVGGGSENSPLEIALAKKCLALYDRLGQINNERNEYFEAIYSATIKFEKATKGTLKHKRTADLARDSKAHFAAAVKLDSELKGLFDNDAKEKI
ncbi:MAG: hypothetical protein IJ982_12195 [Fibrobacter sp.]|nr:hypothetical protein [Fibrobacter sp.]